METRLRMFEEFYHIFDQWITLYENGIGIDSIFRKHGLHKVAIYGMGTMAIHMIRELENTDVCVVCIIDKNRADYFPNIHTQTLDEVTIIPDVVIYTNPNETMEMINCLSEKLQCKVMSLSDIIFDNL